MTKIMETDGQGMVQIYCFWSKRWEKRNPIDAVDILKGGGGSLDGPPTESDASGSSPASDEPSADKSGAADEKPDEVSELSGSSGGATHRPRKK